MCACKDIETKQQKEYMLSLMILLEEAVKFLSVGSAQPYL